MSKKTHHAAHIGPGHQTDETILQLTYNAECYGCGWRTTLVTGYRAGDCPRCGIDRWRYLR